LLKDAAQEGYFKQSHRDKMRHEAVAILAVVILLASLDWRYVTLYYGVFYLGWSLINMHNYGQHLPRERQLELGNSFYGRLYNRVFVNNGLHYEHHKEPNIPYWELAELPSENTRNAWPHTVDGIRFDVTERRPQVP
jgi:fatty acid desaturase